MFFILCKDLLKEFILELEIKKYSPRTIKSYRNNNSLFFNFLQSEFNITVVEEIKPINIKSYIKFLQQKKLTTTYINGLIKCFRAFFKYALDEEIIEINPMDRVGWIKENKVLINTFNDEEVQRMLNCTKGNLYLDIRNKAILSTLVDTGIRCLELCNIRNKDVTERTIRIINGKGNKERVVPISPYLRKSLDRYIRCRDLRFKDRNIDNDTPFFLSFRFKALTVEGIERVIKDIGIKAEVRKEIRCSPHTLRHYFAQAQLKNGLDVYSLSRLLGHENISITKRYLQGLKDEEIVEMSIKTSPLMNLRGR